MLFLLAYTFSGLAGLIYEVSWTRLLTLYIGHTTAAASAVVAAFLGGLAVGAALGGRVASRLDPRSCLKAYVGLELSVVVFAFVLPFELSLLTPLLRSAYADGAPGLWFPIVRVASCFLLVFIPAFALGATFPMAIRWFSTDGETAARSTGVLYVMNTVGAAAGSVLAGFVLIPRFGITGTVRVGMLASAFAASCVLAVLFYGKGVGDHFPESPGQQKGVTRAKVAKLGRKRVEETEKRSPTPFLGTAILGLSGFAALVHEIAWTRILAMTLGPTTYAFAATLAAVIAGVAIGSAIGTVIVGRTRQPASWLAAALALAAIATTLTYSMVGNRVPMMVARAVTDEMMVFDQLVQRATLLAAMLIVPTSACLGAAFPLALAIVNDPSKPAARQFGLVYAINTIGAVTGSLATGFWLIPQLGLRPTLYLVSGCLIAGAAIVTALGQQSSNARWLGGFACAAGVVLMVSSPPWDRQLLASGVYMYAPFVPKDLDLITQLKAGTLMYYKEGAAATVSVKKLTGTTTLAVDGKVDASNRGDMLTQKLIAHLPLLLHDNPKDVAIIGLGSGATLGAALSHPIARADVMEISPEVVEASRFFTTENHDALKDPRTNLIVGDGRSHLLLSARKYDAIISEPSNPWIAGVSALFTREFFQASRDRLAPGGIVCQWANAYNISEVDLRSIVATFRSVFPDGYAWLVSGDDVLLVGSNAPLEPKLANIAKSFARPGVARDLAEVAVAEPFSVLSMFVGGPPELTAYAGDAPVFTDDRMTLEFSAPRELHRRLGGENGAALSALLADGGGPAIIRDSRTSATASNWRLRGNMEWKADMHALAYDDYVKALTADPSDRLALDGLVRVAIADRRASDALAWIKSLSENRPATVDVLVARSKLLAAVDARPEALDVANDAIRLDRKSSKALEQLAALHADAGEVAALEGAVAALHDAAPTGAATFYYDAAARLLKDDAAGAAESAKRAIAADPEYTATYDLIGAAYTKLNKADEARQAFQKSLAFDAHDSAAYTNLGMIDLAAGDRAAAANHFAEALWLAPESQAARDGLTRARTGSP